jgi:O-acetyl-ADP-ribose deacetylase (regulator of RNase III)
MIVTKHCDLLSNTRGILVHGVNCQGQMNSGIARDIRAKYPVAYTEYASLCAPQISHNTQNTLLGTTQFVPIVENELYVANCFTQEFYGRSGKRYASPEAITACMRLVASTAENLALPIYMPIIGCGLGGLSWALDVMPLMVHISDDYPFVPITVCVL